LALRNHDTFLKRMDALGQEKMHLVWHLANPAVRLLGELARGLHMKAFGINGGRIATLSSYNLGAAASYAAVHEHIAQRSVAS